MSATPTTSSNLNCAVNGATFPLHELTDVLQATARVTSMPNLGPDHQNFLAPEPRPGRYLREKTQDGGS